MPAVDHDNVHAAAAACLGEAEVERKLSLTAATAHAFAQGRLSLDEALPPAPIGEPGRPAKPLLVAPRQLAQRGLGSEAGRAALVHAVAHIEFNAINLAWDAVYRFRGMPAQYYADWIAVAADEARHFSLLQRRLAISACATVICRRTTASEMARKTADSCLERMALVPRVLEARGLDVTPGMIDRLRAVGDTTATVAILEQILAEEVAHVAAGTRWFTWCCERAGVDAADTFDALLQQHYRGALKPPFNRRDRLAAGFSALELDRLDSLVA